MRALPPALATRAATWAFAFAWLFGSQRCQLVLAQVPPRPAPPPPPVVLTAPPPLAPVAPSVVTAPPPPLTVAPSPLPPVRMVAAASPRAGEETQHCGLTPEQEETLNKWRDAWEHADPEQKHHFAMNLSVEERHTLFREAWNKMPDEAKSDMMAKMVRSLDEEELHNLTQAFLRNFTQAEKFAMLLPTCPLTPEPDGQFLEKNWGITVVVAWLLIVTSLMAGYSIWWHVYAKGETKRSLFLEEVESYSQALVQMLSPSTCVQGYRFRGISARPTPVSVEFDNLGLLLHNGTCVLQGVTGEFNGAGMAAILGPSGAGKTSFLNALCGKATYGTTFGDVFMNGEEPTRDFFRYSTGFVPQDDIVHEELTVRENLRYSARLRTPPTTSWEQVCEITNDVLNVMQLGHIQNTIVGGFMKRGISGGQRKRVNIGIELASCPTLLFLDEPTSGLDATSSLQVINSLKKMTELGMTIIMVIHQPRYNLFTLFDNVLLLGRGGRTVFQGPSQAAKPYFERLGFRMPELDNPADWIMDVISGQVKNHVNPELTSGELFDTWEQKKYTASKESVHVKSRRWTKHDDRAALASNLDEAWDSIDTDGSGSIQPEELSHVLKACTGVDPADDVLEELIHRMSGVNATEVDRVHFQTYIQSLAEVMANGHERHIEKEKEDEDDENCWVKCCSFGLHHVPSETDRPGCLQQFRIVLRRNLIKNFRAMAVKRRVLFMVVVTMFALVIGALPHMSHGDMTLANRQYCSMVLLFHLPLAMMVVIVVLPIFQDRLIFLRESRGGLSTNAYFLANLLVTWFDVFLLMTIYAIMYYLVARPLRSPFRIWFIPIFMLALPSSGLACLLSAMVPVNNATMCGVVVVLVVDLILGMVTFLNTFFDSSTFTFIVGAFSGSRWSVPMTFVTNYEQAVEDGECIDVMQTIPYEVYRKGDSLFDYGPWWSGIIATSVQAVVLHGLALVYLNLSIKKERG